jgi:hypothetical protein
LRLCADEFEEPLRRESAHQRQGVTLEEKTMVVEMAGYEVAAEA